MLTPSDACYEDEMAGVGGGHEREPAVDDEIEATLTPALYLHIPQNSPTLITNPTAGLRELWRHSGRQTLKDGGCVIRRGIHARPTR